MATVMNRLVGVNGSVKPLPGSKGPTAAQRARAVACRKAERWAHCYTGTAVVLSSGLNAYYHFDFTFI